MNKSYNWKINKSRILMLFLLVFLQYFNGFSQGKFGVNLVNDMAFINVINEGGRFNNTTTYDAQGWPQSDFKSVFDWRLVAEWFGTVDDPEAYRIKMSGIYKASFIGQADISIMGAALSNKVYDAASNTTTFDITVPTNNNGRVYWEITFSNTKRTSTSATNSGLTSLKIMRPGYALNTTQVFTNDYINLCKSASFACYRYYNVNNVWDGVPTYPAATTWNNRKLPTDASQTNMLNINGKSEGWCWEYIVQMANMFKKDIWINIHVSADDNYVTNLATKLKNELDPAINIYVELGNEVWSPDWHVQDKWLDDQAKAQGITFIDNYAKNVVRLSNLFKNVYGATAINSKIRVVLGAQQGWVGRSETHLNYIKNNLGDPKTFVYALAPATYFDAQGNTIEDALNECHTEIMKEYDDENDDPSLAKFMRVAKTWGLPGVCVSYEGQEHGVIGETNNLPVKIGIHRDPRMATEQYFNFQSFFDNGGTLACQFGLWAPYTRYGCWGLTDDPSNPDRNFKFKAARNLCGDANGMPIPAIPAAPTCLAITPVTTTQVTLSWVDNATNEEGYEIWYKETTATIWKYYSTVGPNKTSEVFNFPVSGKTYEYRVRAYNFSQWSAYNQPCGVTDTQAPSAPTLSSTGKTTTSVDLSWTASTDNIGVTGYDVFNGTNKVNTTNITGTTFTVTGLTASTAYTFTVKARDAAGNTSAASNAVTVSTNAPAATCSGTGSILREYWANITGTTVSSIPILAAPTSSNQLTIFEGPIDIGDNYGSRMRGYLCPPITGNYIFWIASDDNSELWLSTNDQSANKVKIASVADWTSSREWTKYPSQQSATISLQAGQRYYIEVLHKEGTGGDNISVGWQLPDATLERPIPGNRLIPYVVPAGEYDTQAPTAPTLSSTGKTTTSVSLSWTASTDNVGVSGYDVFNGTNKVNTTNITGTTFTVTGLTASTAYTFTVKARDAAGNTSAASNAVTVSTDAAPDTQAPTAPTLSSTGKTTTSVSLSWTASTDNVGVSGYDVFNGTTKVNTTNITGTTFTVTGLTASTAYTFTVKARDAAGNVSTASNAVTVTTNATATHYSSISNNSSGVIVDGALNEADWILSNEVVKIVNGTTNNNTITFGTLWDANYLYVGVKIIDANLYNDSPNIHDDDAIELYIDADHNHGTTYDNKDFQFMKRYNDNGIWEKRGAISGVLNKWLAINGGFTVEIAFPWSTLGVTPSNNLKMGFDLGYNDDDNGGARETQLMWNGTNMNWSTTEYFGELVLSGVITSLNKQEKVNQLTIYPQPNQGNFVLSFKNSEIGEYNVSIYNSLGVKVKEQKFVKDSENFETEMDINGYGNGMFYIEIHNGKTKITGNVIKN